jgi:hypothetical protein
MSGTAPKIIAIDHDDYAAKHIGWTSDGRQFFLTTPFEPTTRDRKEDCEFIALYLFDAQGKLLEAHIDSLGPRASVDTKAACCMCEKRLQDLGKVSFERIEIAPFSIERFGSIFGLVLRDPEDEDDQWAVEVEPGNYMAFFEPWDSGEYDT